ncbi:putative metal-dependent hydrolase [Hymenobacter busanensis]|uniref:Metal-dependent hydrolase n=1 Tax=Hymenobacter busanensis TaxID=2607656 RepID=A0A7L4ZUU3_9BACT|nr:putative metal-dependent hydrolase [Hymenobacter busanensis]KAA9332458.1 putative metal-dependent hydrolase [Hymenobacter busanensis]QHJ07204.1 putative metal-dependent hydrolase [Hymenobacter busanensis]
MNEPTDEHLRFPIGRVQLPEQPLSAAERAVYIQQIADLPAQLTAAARAAGGVQLEQPYRPGGWNGRQVIHHLADMHPLLYARFRQALTEDEPTVPVFQESAWAELPDVAATPVTVSLALLEQVHTRWVVLMHHLSEAQWQRRLYHPRLQRWFTLDQALVQYAWHGRHHLGHIKLLATGN